MPVRCPRRPHFAFAAKAASRGPSSRPFARRWEVRAEAAAGFIAASSLHEHAQAIRWEGDREWLAGRQRVVTHEIDREVAGELHAAHGGERKRGAAERAQEIDLLDLGGEPVWHALAEIAYTDVFRTKAHAHQRAGFE